MTSRTLILAATLLLGSFASSTASADPGRGHATNAHNHAPASHHVDQRTGHNTPAATPGARGQRGTTAANGGRGTQAGGTVVGTGARGGPVIVVNTSPPPRVTPSQRARRAAAARQAERLRLERLRLERLRLERIQRQQRIERLRRIERQRRAQRAGRRGR